MQAELGPIRARRKEWEQRIPDVMEILKEGSRVAEAKAALVKLHNRNKK